MVRDPFPNIAIRSRSDYLVKTLKIDRSVIGRMGQGGQNSEIMRTINTLANNLGMEVVARRCRDGGPIGPTQS
ncbi:MAG: hypothetical protein LC776_20295 [Acidobacteria bacterium]|nr:hypothetical protein [Acidobacteriota bacterium]